MVTKRNPGSPAEATQLRLGRETGGSRSVSLLAGGANGCEGTLSFSVFPRGFETDGGARVPGGAGTQS